MKSFFVLITAVLYLFNPAACQQSASRVVFRPVWGDAPLFLGKTYGLCSGHDSVQVHALKFYVSGLKLLRRGKVVWEEPDSFHLLDAEETGSLQWNLSGSEKVKFDALSFQIGIDSLTNVSGALGGDLDPTKGMYWTWQSGYINFKLDGTSPSCPARKNRFQFHLGGYAAPFSSIQTISLKPINTREIMLNVDVGAFLEKIDLKSTYEVMSPGEPSVRISKTLPEIFILAQ